MCKRNLSNKSDYNMFSIFDMLFTSGGETYTKDELLERGITEKLL